MQMKKVEELLILLEKYKHVDFKKIDRVKFDKIRAEETKNFDKLNDESILKVVAYIVRKYDLPLKEVQKIFKTAIDRKSFADVVLVADNLKRQGALDSKDLDFIKSVSKEFGRKMDKLNLDLIADDKTLEKEGFFKDYPHLKK